MWQGYFDGEKRKSVGIHLMAGPEESGDQYLGDQGNGFRQHGETHQAEDFLH